MFQSKEKLKRKHNQGSEPRGRQVKENQATWKNVNEIGSLQCHQSKYQTLLAFAYSTSHTCFSCLMLHDGKAGQIYTKKLTQITFMFKVHYGMHMPRISIVLGPTL